MVTKIYIEDYLIDLFKDETIELNSSIANTDDISKINSDYTKTFTVPASDRNNYFFKHYYNADIDNTFDARTKKTARIELAGFGFKSGKIRLDKVSVKKGKPSSYTINFWGDGINIKNLFKDDELSVLDFSVYTHEQTSDNIKEGLTVGLFGGDVVYNLISNKRQFLYDETPSNDTNTDDLVNIAYNGSNRGILFNELKPSLKLLPIIEAIEAKYGITFTRDFFGRSEFSELCLWLSKDKGNIIGGGTQRIDFDGGDSDNVDFVTDVATFTVDSTFFFSNRIEINPNVSYMNVPYTLRVFKDGELFSEQTHTGRLRSFFYVTSLLPISHDYYFEIQSNVIFKYSVELLQSKQDRATLSILDTYVTTASENTISSNIDLSLNMPKIKIIDFMRGLFQMFKLVVVPVTDTHFYVNTIKDYYREGRILDVTKYIDFESFDVERGVINNQIDFKYQEPTTILNSEFKKNTGIAYGDELLSLADVDGVPLDGEKLDITLPFEQLLFERLLNIQDNTLSNVQYGLVVNSELETVNPKPLIFYNNNSQLSGSDVSFINETGISEVLNTTLNTPAHTLGLDSHSFSTLWGVEFSTWDYVAINDTLFYNYWLEYITSIFNIKKRKFKYNAYLPFHLLTDLKLNDVLFIKDRYYRINDFTVNLLTGKTSLNLLNTFETNFGVFAPNQTSVYLNYKVQTYSVYVSNAPAVMGIVKENTGFGTSWAAIVQNGSFLEITVTENTGAINRDMFINVDNGGTKTFQIYLNQDNKVVTFDSTITTFDSEIITFDAI